MKILQLNSEKLAFITDTDRFVTSINYEELLKMKEKAKQEFLANKNNPELAKKYNDLMDMVETRKLMPQHVGPMEHTLKIKTPQQIENMGDPAELIRTAERLLRGIASSPVNVQQKEEAKTELETIMSYLKIIREEIKEALGNIKENYGNKISEYFKRLTEIEYLLYPAQEEPLTEENM